MALAFLEEALFQQRPFERELAGVVLMSVEKFRSWLVVASLGLMLVAAFPTINLLIRLPSDSESFSELWLLDPNHKAEDYPFNVSVNVTYSVFVGVGNRLGYSAYYRVFLKFRNQTQPLPVDSDSTPSPLPALYEFDFFARDGEVWETLVNFNVLESDYSNDALTVKTLSINDVNFRVDSISLWNTEKKGFYYQLFFELWLFSNATQKFAYNSRFVSLWLNVTV